MTEGKGYTEEIYEIGYGFLDQYQGKGYAKESLLAIFDYMKNRA